MNYSVVLSDSLLLEYYNFKNNREYRPALVENLFKNYKSPYLTNVSQLQRLGIGDSELLSQLLSSGLTDQSIEELCKKTKYKIILHESLVDYPYLNISKDNIELNYSSTYYGNHSRKKAKDHIKALLSDATNIFIYDKFIANQWTQTSKLFTELLPKKQLTVFYTENHLNNDLIAEIKKYYKLWNIKIDLSSQSYRNLHDRYMVIDKKIEIILSSGIDHLFSDSKDFTYIVRDLER